jgi:8-oxo-dGTP diphosphatase
VEKSGAILTLGKDDQKILEGRYQVSPRTLCFITDGDEVLLLRGASNKRIWPNLYNGVGGHVEARENVRDAALREIHEETGLQVRGLKLRGVVNIPVEAQSQGIMLFVFAATACSRDVVASTEGAAEWVRCGDLNLLDLVDDVPVLLERILDDTKTDAPFFARYEYDEQDRLNITFAD